ncbi:MAG: hypothetical protein FWD73_02895 [Polyangiaceae bacterium]|nr:hypothetical protein [Polyangiaceae bacterium]
MLHGRGEDASGMAVVPPSVSGFGNGGFGSSRRSTCGIGEFGGKVGGSVPRHADRLANRLANAAAWRLGRKHQHPCW